MTKTTQCLIRLRSVSGLILLCLIGIGPTATAGTRVVAWGRNDPNPTNVAPGLSNVVAIAVGSSFDWDLALKDDGTVVGWGDNSSGQLDIPPGLSNVIAIAAGGCALALKVDGTVVAWGLDDWGQSEVPAGLSNVVAIAASVQNSVALRADGTVVAWGWFASEPGYQPPGTLSNVVAIACGHSFGIALKADGTATSWPVVGSVLGADTDPTLGLSNVVSIACGDWTALALKADGTAEARGTFGTEVGGAIATFPMELSNLVAVAASDTLGQYDLALLTDGTVVIYDRISTNVITGLSNVQAIATSPNPGHSLALVGQSPPVVHESMVNPHTESSGFSVSLPTQSGRVYLMEYKVSLRDTNWKALPLTAGTGGLLRFTDPTADGRQRFYRVRRW